MKNNKNKQCIIYIFQNLTTARWLEKWEVSFLTEKTIFKIILT